MSRAMSHTSHSHQRANSCLAQRAACPSRPTSPSAPSTRVRGQGSAEAASPRTRNTKHPRQCGELGEALRGQDGMEMVLGMTALGLLLLRPQKPSAASRRRGRDPVPREPSASNPLPRPRKPTSRFHLPTHRKASAPFLCQACQAVHSPGHMSAASDPRCGMLACSPVFGRLLCVIVLRLCLCGLTAAYHAVCGPRPCESVSSTFFE